MKKAMLLMLLVLPVFTVFAAGGSQGQKKIILRWSTIQPDTNVITQAMERIAKEANPKLGDRVEIQVFSNGALGNVREVAEGIQTGMVEMSIDGSGVWANWIPMASLGEAPYLYRDPTHLSLALNGPPGKRYGEYGASLNEELLKRNVRLLGAFYYGTRQLTTTKAEVRSVKDMQGLKIRAPEAKVFIEMVKSWGASPTPIPLGDLYLSLSTNVVDGQENPLPTFNSYKFYEIQKYVIMTNHIIAAQMVYINEDAWKKISPADQKIIEEAIDNGIKWNDEATIKAEVDLRKTLTDRGVIFIEPDVESFRSATRQHMINVMGPEFGGAAAWYAVENIR